MTKKILLFVAVIGALVFAWPAADCRAANIAGGSSLDNAVELKAGTHTGGAINGDTTQYFYVTLGQGQQITAKVLYTTNVQYGTLSTLALYDQDRNQVVEQFEANYSTVTLTANWLVNGDQSSYKYYLKLASDDDGISSYNLTLTIANKYDGGSTQDAPTTFEKALSVTAGTTKGYLAGGTEAGNDTTDMYALVPTVNGSYTITVTPPTDGQIGVTVYDANRQEVDSQIGNNAGSIVTSTVQAAQGANLFIKVGCDYYCSNTLTEYQMVIAAPATTNTNGSTTAVNQNVNASSNANANTNTAVKANSNGNINTNTAAKDEESDSLTLYLIIGGAVILVALIVVIIIVVKKKKTSAPTQEPPAKK
ncbi:MAG: hypothetical protein WC528_03500 [Patescibacteria group bacterium]